MFFLKIFFRKIKKKTFINFLWAENFLKFWKKQFFEKKIFKKNIFFQKQRKYFFQKNKVLVYRGKKFFSPNKFFL